MPVSVTDPQHAEEDNTVLFFLLKVTQRTWHAQTNTHTHIQVVVVILILLIVLWLGAFKGAFRQGRC